MGGKAFGEQVRQARDAKGLSQADLGKRVGATQQAIEQLENGKVRRPRYIIDLARELDLEIEGLPRVMLPAPTDIVELLGELYAVVPVFDARVSAGPGAINEDAAPLHHHLYRMAWLREVTSTPPAELAVVRVEGDSMWETLHNGDHVLMDRRTRRIGRDGIYVLAWAGEDETMVKRAQRDPRNKLITVKSDNPEYQVWPDVPDEKLRVFGKVIWLGRNVGG